MLNCYILFYVVAYITQYSLFQSISYHIQKRISFLRERQLPPIVTSNMSFRSQVAVNNFIKGQLRLCEKSNIADLFSTSARVSKKNSRDTYLKPHLPAIAARLKAITDTPWKFRDASAVIYGLMYMDEDDPGLMDIVKIMTPVIKRIAFSSDQNVSPEDVVMLFLGLQRLTAQKKVMLSMISVLVPLLKACEKKFTGHDISNTIYGLMMMSSESVEIRELIKELGVHLKECKGDLSAKDCVSVAFGLRNKSSEHIEIREMFLILAEKIKSCEEEMTHLNITNIIAALPGANSDHAEVRELLSAMLLKAKPCTEAFQSKSLSRAVCGMKGMCSDRREVRSLIALLAAKIRKNDEEWSALSITMVFLGIQRMTDCQEVLELLSAIVAKVRNLKVEMESQQIGDCLYGLQDLTDKSTAVRNVLFALNVELRKGKSVFTPKAISDSLYGLQNMKPESGDLLDVFSILSQKMRIIPEDLKFTILDISNALYGLQGLLGKDNNTAFLSVLDVLCKRAQLVKEDHSDGAASVDCAVRGDGKENSSGSEKEEVSSESIVLETVDNETQMSDLISLHQSMLFFLNEHHNNLDEKRITEIKCVIDDVTNILDCKKNEVDVILKKEIIKNDKIVKISEVASKLLRNVGNANILQNKVLFNIFETSLLLLLPHNEKTITINIEIDSVSNKKEKKKLYRNRRDSYLTANGISIIRIHESKIDGMLESDIETWLNKNISDIKNKLI